MSSICEKCIEDVHLRKTLEFWLDEGDCCECGAVRTQVVTFEKLGSLAADIIEEHFTIGEQEPYFGGADDDKVQYEQAGQPLTDIVQDVLGQFFKAHDAIVEATIDAGNVGIWPPDGDEPFFDYMYNYVESTKYTDYLAKWNEASESLKHRSRFFNRQIQAFFTDVFQDFAEMKVYNLSTKKIDTAIATLDAGAVLYRARRCMELGASDEMFREPLRNVGPPPRSRAQAGRMNAEGVVACYASLDRETAVAEIRPTIGSYAVSIGMTLTRPVRILDFSILQRAQAKSLSYFQPDFKDQFGRFKFLRNLANLISQPVIPGNEREYLITQCMCEWLSYATVPELSGVSFSSTQHAGGTNIVLFPGEETEPGASATAFPISYVEESITLSYLKSVKYQIIELDTYTSKDGSVFVFRDHE